MKATQIPGHESSFFTNKKDAHGKGFQLTDMEVPIRGSNESMPYVKCIRTDHDDSYYYAEKFEKTQIVLHFTAGYLKGDVAVLTTPSNHVSVPFILARNGTILNMWSSAFWSYHLGPGAIGGNTKGSRRTIGIEISNIGYLKKIGNHLVTAYRDDDVYCSLDETSQYIQLETPYRGHLYFANYTNEQYESLIVLLKYLTAEYDIPRVFLPFNERYEIGNVGNIPDFRGIVSHVNYRPSGKWDIGPAFDWERVVDGLA